MTDAYEAKIVTILNKLADLAIELGLEGGLPTGLVPTLDAIEQTVDGIAASAEAFEDMERPSPGLVEYTGDDSDAIRLSVNVADILLPCSQPGCTGNAFMMAERAWWCAQHAPRK